MKNYRNDVSIAVNFFRPVLSKLNIRNKEKQEDVFLVEFDHLDFLNLETCVVTVLLANLDKAGGLFFCRKTENITACYIILNSNLYNNEGNLEKVKIVGVHEFCHFMAIIYSLTATTIEKQRDFLTKRLSKKIDDFDIAALNTFYQALTQDDVKTDDIAEFSDNHFRLDCEGDTVNYDVLFNNFLFSKELFEEYFKREKQKQFKILLEKADDASVQEGISLYMQTITNAAEDKSVPVKYAKKQAFAWVKDYLK